MLVNEDVQNGGDPYGSHIGRLTICITYNTPMQVRPDTPLLYPLAQRLTGHICPDDSRRENRAI